MASLFLLALVLVLSQPALASDQARELAGSLATEAFDDLPEKVILERSLKGQYPALAASLPGSVWQTTTVEILDGQQPHWLQVAISGNPKHFAVIVADQHQRIMDVFHETDVFRDAGYFHTSYWLKIAPQTAPARIKIYIARSLDGTGFQLRQFRVMPDSARDDYRTSILLVAAAYFGAFATLLIYNLGFAIHLRSGLHGLYSLYCAASITQGMTVYGLLYDETRLPFGGLYHRFIDLQVTWAFGAVTVMFCLVFLNRQFQNIWLRQSVFAALVLTFLSPFGFFLQVSPTMVVMLFNIFIIAAGLLCLLMVIFGAVRKSRSAWLLLIAFSPLLIVSLLRTLSSNWGVLIQNGLQIATVFEALILSWGLTERIRRIREDGLRAMAENAARSDYFANMAHELRTPLNAIIGFSDALKAGIGGKLQDKQREYVGDIQDSGGHLLTLINDVLDMSKSEAGKLELFEQEVDVGEQVLRCLPFVREQAQQGRVSLVSDIQPDLPLMKLDARMVRQMVVNLLSNAVKFAPKGGQVSLSVKQSASGEMSIMVEDTGQGMAAEDIPVALSPYGQTTTGRHMPGSTGLGLPLVKRMAELHDGSILIESEVGKGTSVMISLPATRLVQAGSPSMA